MLTTSVHVGGVCYDYNAPETIPDQVGGTRVAPYDARKSDVYSLGILMYFLITGLKAFESPTNKTDEELRNERENRSNIDHLKEVVERVDSWWQRTHNVRFNAFLANLMLENLLEPDPAKRITLADVAKESYLTGIYSPWNKAPRDPNDYRLPEIATSTSENQSIKSVNVNRSAWNNTGPSFSQVVSTSSDASWPSTSKQVNDHQMRFTDKSVKADTSPWNNTRPSFAQMVSSPRDSGNESGNVSDAASPSTSCNATRLFSRTPLGKK